jgi:hypothetical protein
VWLGLLVATSVVIVVGAGAVPSETAPVLVPYVPIEPAEPYVTEAMNETTRLWVKYSRRAALHGDLTGAIEQMQIAANTLIRLRNDDFELWDNLAELYCARANREADAKRAAVSRANGLAMLAEYRCGVKVFSGSAYDMSCKTKRGIVPNAAFTPLCYQLFCSEGARDRGAANEGIEEDTEDDPDVYTLYLAKFREDAANLPTIEQVCRAEPKGK